MVVIKPDWADAFYGACLSSFKLGECERSLKHIERAIELTENEAKHQQKNAYVYMKAVCLKKLRRYDESLASYKLLHDIIMRTEN